MALPTSVESAYTKVRHAAEALGAKNRELETAKASGDEDRAKNAQDAYKSAAKTLVAAAKELQSAAEKL